MQVVLHKAKKEGLTRRRTMEEQARIRPGIRSGIRIEIPLALVLVPGREPGRGPGRGPEAWIMGMPRSLAST